MFKVFLDLFRSSHVAEDQLKMGDTQMSERSANADAKHEKNVSVQLSEQLEQKSFDIGGFVFEPGDSQNAPTDVPTQHTRCHDKD